MRTLNDWTRTGAYQDAALWSRRAYEAVINGDPNAPAITKVAGEKFANLDRIRRNWAATAAAA